MHSGPPRRRSIDPAPSRGRSWGCSSIFSRSPPPCRGRGGAAPPTARPGSSSRGTGRPSPTSRRTIGRSRGRPRRPSCPRACRPCSRPIPPAARSVERPRRASRHFHSRGRLPGVRPFPSVPAPPGDRPAAESGPSAGEAPAAGRASRSIHRGRGDSGRPFREDEGEHGKDRRVRRGWSSCSWCCRSGGRCVELYTDWLWFDEVGFSGVFSTILWTKILLGAGTRDPGVPGALPQSAGDAPGTRAAGRARRRGRSAPASELAPGGAALPAVPPARLPRDRLHAERAGDGPMGDVDPVPERRRPSA